MYNVMYVDIQSYSLRQGMAEDKCSILNTLFEYVALSLSHIPSFDSCNIEMLSMALCKSKTQSCAMYTTLTLLNFLLYSNRAS